MAQWAWKSAASYLGAGPTVTLSATGDTDSIFTDGEAPPDDTFTVGTTFQGSFSTYQGTLTTGGHTFLVTFDTVSYTLFSASDLADVTYPASFDLADIDAVTFTVCFALGTEIATPTGAVAVENLAIGTLITAIDGRTIPVRWIGKQTVVPRFQPPERLLLVKFKAGSLGDGVPGNDLSVTADHAMLIDDVLYNAGALVNGTSITRVPHNETGERFTVYHIETENHEIIIANGAPAETFIDNISRRTFDNFAEFEALYGNVPEMRELPYPRAVSARQVPASIKMRLLFPIAV